MFRSQAHIYAQVIDDDAGRTLAAASSLDKDAARRQKRARNVGRGQGRGLADRDPRQGKGSRGLVVFDRGGFQYHGRIKALADAAREAGQVSKF